MSRLSAIRQHLYFYLNLSRLHADIRRCFIAARHGITRRRMIRDAIEEPPIGCINFGLRQVGDRFPPRMQLWLLGVGRTMYSPPPDADADVGVISVILLGALPQDSRRGAPLRSATAPSPAPAEVVFALANASRCRFVSCRSEAFSRQRDTYGAEARVLGSIFHSRCRRYCREMRGAVSSRVTRLKQAPGLSTAAEAARVISSLFILFSTRAIAVSSAPRASMISMASLSWPREKLALAA